MGATVGREMGAWAQEGCGSGDSARGLDLARRAGNRGNPGRAIPWTHLIFQKSGRDRSPDIGGPHIDNYQTPEVENPYSRYDILESLVANSLWVVVWLSDPKVPSA